MFDAAMEERSGRRRRCRNSTYILRERACLLRPTRGACRRYVCVCGDDDDCSWSARMCEATVACVLRRLVSYCGCCGDME
jgi:hypothetical protein